MASDADAIDFCVSSEALSADRGYFVKDVRVSAVEKLSLKALRLRMASEGISADRLDAIKGDENERDMLLDCFKQEVMPDKYTSMLMYLCNTRDGQGKYFHGNGMVYEGQYQDGMKHGQSFRFAHTC